MHWLQIEHLNKEDGDVRHKTSSILNKGSIKFHKTKRKLIKKSDDDVYLTPLS